MSDKPFTICQECGSPILKDEALSLVLMFKNAEDRKFFAETVGKELGLTSFNIDD